MNGRRPREASASGTADAQKSLRERRPVAARCARKQNGSWCRHQPPLVPGPNCRAGEGLASSLGGSGLSRRSKLRRGPCRVPAGVLRPRTVPFRGPLARRLRSPLDPRRKWDRLAPHASPSKTRSTALVACVPKDTARLRGGRVSELSSLAGSPLLIAKRHTARPAESRQGESWPFGLWIAGISWISSANPVPPLRIGPPACPLASRQGLAGRRRTHGESAFPGQDCRRCSSPARVSFDSSVLDLLPEMRTAKDQ
jgi:hypothetical protein